MTQRDYIVESQHNPPPLWVHIRDVILTVLMWVYFVYLTKDVYSNAVKLWDWVVFDVQSVDMPSILATLRLIATYAWFAIPIGASLIGWAIYNQFRFGSRDRERRHMVPALELNEVADSFQIPSKQVATMQSARHITLHHNSAGKIVKIVSLRS